MNALTPQVRQAIRVSNREIMLECARQQGIDATIEMTQCVIDGLADGLRDLDGDKAAFDFCARLSDRMARGVRGATVIPQALKKFQPVPEIVQAPIVEPAAESPAASNQFSWWALSPLAVIAACMVLAVAIQHGHWGG